jgi:hypothetical protein
VVAHSSPRVLLRLGKTELTAVIATASRNHLGAARAEQWLAAAEAAVQLYAEHPAVAFVDLAAEVATEVRLIRGGVLDDGRDVHAGAGEGHGFEEVGGKDGFGLRAQERRPALCGPVGRWVDAGVAEDLPDS